MKKAKHSTFNIQHSTPKGLGTDDWELNEGAGADRKFDLENRLLAFASAVIDLSENLPNTRAANHVAGQLLRSGTAPYPNHGEAEAAESRDDFIHKLKIGLKELREARRWTRLIQSKRWTKDETALLFVLSEAEELIRIFFASIQTARRNAQPDERRPASRNRFSSAAAG